MVSTYAYGVFSENCRYPFDISFHGSLFKQKQEIRRCMRTPFRASQGHCGERECFWFFRCRSITGVPCREQGYSL